MGKSAPGFSLIELVIAITIASILSLMVFMFVNRSGQVNKRVATAVDYGLALTVAYSQLERDLMAIMVPESAFATYKRSLKKTKPEKTEETEPATDKPEKRKRDLPVPFFARATDNKLDLLFFTTTNRMTRHKVFAPYNSRVVYQLVPDDALPGHFKLVRSESNNLARPIEDFTRGDVHGHVLLSRIKSLSIKLFVPEEPKAEPKAEPKQAPEKDGQEQAKPAEKQPQPQKDKKIIYKELTSWDPAQLKGAPYMVPAYIEISGERTELDGKNTRPFVIACKISVFEWQYERIKKIVELMEKERKQTKPAGDKKSGKKGDQKIRPSLAKPALGKPALNKPVGKPVVKPQVGGR